MVVRWESLEAQRQPIIQAIEAEKQRVVGVIEAAIDAFLNTSPFGGTTPCPEDFIRYYEYDRGLSDKAFEIIQQKYLEAGWILQFCNIKFTLTATHDESYVPPVV